MTELNPRSTAKIAGHPIHPMLVPFPIAFFAATFGVDLVYLVTGDPFWARSGIWLLTAGLGFAVLAALAGLTDFLSDGRIRAIRNAWQHMLGNVIVVLLSIVNLYLRCTKGAVEAVVPSGVILSAVVVVILLYTGWMGGELVFRRRVGVSDR